MAMAVASAAFSATTFSAAAGFAFSASVFAKSFALNLVLTALSGALAKPGKQQSQPTYQAEARDRKQVVRSAVEPHRIVYGQTLVSGPLAYAESTGPDNQYLHLVLPVAAHEVEEIGEIYLNDEPLGTLDADGYPTTGRYAGRVRVRKHLGSASQTADATLLTESAGAWTAAHRGRGRAYVYVRLTWNQNVFSGIPTIAAVVKGKKVLDPRTGLTAWSDNWALCMRDYLTASYGLAAGSSEIDDDAVIAAANICDEDVTIAAGSPTQTQKRYTCNGTVNLSDRPVDILTAMATAAAGVVLYTQGVYRIKAGAYEAPSHDIDASWLRGAVRVRARPPRRELYNAVRGTYTAADRLWEPTDFPPVTNSTYESQDGGQQIPRDIELPYTDDPIAAQRIAKIHLEKSRQGITVELPCNLKAFPVAVWDTVRLTLDVLGWDEKIFRVVQWSFNPGGGVDLTLQEEAAASYSWSFGDATVVDPAPDTTLPSPFIVQPPGNPSVVETIYETTGSAGVKTRATASWAAAPDAFVTDYEAQYRPQGATDWLSLSPVSLLTAQKDDLAPGFYEFRVRAVNGIGVRSSWSATTTKELIGLTEPPSDPTGFAVQAYAGQGKAVWNKPPRSTDLDVLIGGRAWIRHSPATAGAAWTDGTLVNKDGFPGDAASAPVPLLTGTYMIKFSDSSGNYSANMASFSVTEALLTSLTTLATLTEHSAFAGAKTNTYVDGGELKLGGAVNWDSIPGNIDTWGYVDYAGGVSSTGSYAFASKMDLGSAKNFRLIASLTSNAFDTGDTWDDRTDDIDDWGLVDGGDVEDAEVQVMVRITTDDPASGGATWGPWHPLSIAGDYYARGVDARLDFTSGSVTHNRRVTALTLTAKQ